MPLIGCFEPKFQRVLVLNKNTLPETNIAHENPIFPGKYHQNGGFSMAMLVSGSVSGNEVQPRGVCYLSGLTKDLQSEILSISTPLRIHGTGIFAYMFHKF